MEVYDETFKRDDFLERHDAKKGIYLGQCTQLVEPSLAWVRLGKKAVQDYFQAIKEQGKVTLREAKLMLVGRPNMGKTTLSGKLRDRHSPMPAPEASTRGIAVTDWVYRYEKDKEQYTVHIWDFGGQDIQYSLHQFFMTERAIYGLLDSTREYYDQAAGGDLYANYWLQTIDKLAKGSPTIHVYNHHQGQQKNTSIHNSLCQQYAFLKEDPVVVDLLHVDQDDLEAKNLERLQLMIQKEVAQLPNVGLVLPKKWADIRLALLERAKACPILTLTDYKALCRAQGIQDEKVMLLISSYLHEIGSIIHYHQDAASPLYRLLILNRQWATSAVYEVADSELVAEQKGLFKKADLVTIWENDKALSQDQVASYKDHLPELLELIQKFEVCYPYGGDRFLIPQLTEFTCSFTRPTPTLDCVQLEYKYEFMPYGLLYRLAVRLHDYIQDRQIWRKGMVLTKSEEAEKGWIVLEEKRRQQAGSIHLSINGNKRQRHFLQQRIDEQFQDLHRIFNIEDQVTLLVPCICSMCVHSDQPFQYKYREELLFKLKSGKTPVKECGKSLEEVNILALIDHAFEERPAEAQNILKEQELMRHGLGDIHLHHYHKEVFQADALHVTNTSNSHNQTAGDGSHVQAMVHSDGGQQEAPAPSPTPPAPRKWYQHWMVWVALSAVLAFGVGTWAAFFAFPFYAWVWGLVAALLVGLWVWQMNPERIFVRYAGTFIFIAVVTNGLRIGVDLDTPLPWGGRLTLKSFDDWAHFGLTAVFVLAGAFCLYLHYLNKNQRS